MTLKEYLHKPNARLDKIAKQAEQQRTAEEERRYEKRVAEHNKH